MSGLTSVKLSSQGAAPILGSSGPGPSVSREEIVPSADGIFNSPPVNHWIRTVRESSERLDHNQVVVLPEQEPDLSADLDDVYDNLVDNDENDEEMLENIPYGISQLQLITLMHLLNLGP